MLSSDSSSSKKTSSTSVENLSALELFQALLSCLQETRWQVELGSEGINFYLEIGRK
jgi:hypothetical protein